MHLKRQSYKNRAHRWITTSCGINFCFFKKKSYMCTCIFCCCVFWNFVRERFKHNNLIAFFASVVWLKVWNLRWRFSEKEEVFTSQVWRGRDRRLQQLLLKVKSVKVSRLWFYVNQVSMFVTLTMTGLICMLDSLVGLQWCHHLILG